MLTKLVCYSLGNVDSVVRRNFHREMYGYRDVSCNGKYVYNRKGAIHTVSHKKVFDSMILTNDVRPLLKILRKYGAKTRVFDILTKSGQ